MKTVAFSLLSLALVTSADITAAHAQQGKGAKYGGGGPCASDVAKFCSHAANDRAARNACLANNRANLSAECRAAGQRARGQ